MPSVITAGTATNTALNLTSDTSGELQIRTNNGSTTALTLTTGGNINIPTSGARITGDFSNATPANRLSFQSSTTNGNTTIQVFPNGTASISALLLSSSSNTTNFNYGALLATASEVQLAATYVGSGSFLPLTFATGGSERLRIDTSGNVGIGTSSPTITSGYTGLHINNASFGGQLHLSGGGSGAAVSDGSIFTHTGTELYINNQEAGPTLFYNNGSERMRLDSSGKLYLGTTTDFGANINTRVLSAGGIGMTIQANVNGNWAHEFRNASGTNVGTIVINAGGTAYNTTSDYRLKENIAPITGALSKIQHLKPCTYTWKSDGSAGQGFIAHELQAVVPDCVTGAKDAVDADGKPIYQGVDTSFLVATLTAAIQELKAELDEAKAEIQALKGAQ